MWRAIIQKNNGKTSWDDHRYFLAIARTRSLTGAAKLLCVSQPTVLRRLEAMEKCFSTWLFKLNRKGYELTLVGVELLETVTSVEEQLDKADRNILTGTWKTPGSCGLRVLKSLSTGISAPISGHLCVRTMKSSVCLPALNPFSVSLSASPSNHLMR